MIKIKYEKPSNAFSFTSEDYFTVSNKKLLETSNSQPFQQFTLDINVAYRLMGFKGNILCIGIKSILKNCKNLPGIFDGFLGGYFGE